MFHNSLHEIGHHVPSYLGLLEKFNDLQKTSYPINIYSGLQGTINGYDLVTVRWMDSMASPGVVDDNIKYVCGTLGCNESEKDILVSYKDAFNPLHRNGMSALGHTNYGVTKPLEDHAESFALGSMTNKFSALTIIVKKWNEHAQKLVDRYKNNLLQIDNEFECMNKGNIPMNKKDH